MIGMVHRNSIYIKIELILALKLNLIADKLLE
jgi:hypothetical protein